jgi:acetyltransferase
MAFIATTGEPGEETEIGVARYGIEEDGTTCEFAIVVADEWREKGVAYQLMKALMTQAKSRGLRVMRGDVLASNAPMLDLAESLGFAVRVHEGDGALREISKVLRSPRPTARSRKGRST